MGRSDISGSPPESSNGKGAASRLNNPMGMASDGAGSLYVADVYNQAIRMEQPRAPEDVEFSDSKH